MRNYLLLLCTFCVLVISCKKDKNDDPQPAAWEWFKLKTVVHSYTSAPEFRDSTEIIVDSPNNKIIFKGVRGSILKKDTAVEIFTYNSQHQLVLYERTDTDNHLFISRMEFVRDGNGQLTKVLSQYKNGRVLSSEGMVKYDKRGDTTFISFIDSTVKYNPAVYPHGQDFYKVGLVNGRIVYNKKYLMLSPWVTDSIQNSYIYDATGNIASGTYQDVYGAVSLTYHRDNESPKELQKFLLQWAGDLLWFRRDLLFSFRERLATVNTVGGNTLAFIRHGSTMTDSYINAYDTKGNLTSVSWISFSAGSPPSIYTNTEKYTYRP